MAGQSQQRGWILNLHRVLLSLNLAIAGETLVCVYWHGLENRFYRIELLILEKWDIIQFGRPTYRDFSSGYIAFWLPVLLLGLFLWALLWLSSRTRFTREIFRSVAGYVALFVIPGLWIFPSLPTAPYRAWVRILFHRGAAIELAVAVFCTSRYISRRWSITASRSVVLVALHFIYWFHMPYPFPSSAWLIPYIVGLPSSVVWGAYLRSRQDAGADVC